MEKLASSCTRRRSRKLFVLAMVALLLCWPLPGKIEAAAGDLDPSFDGDGKVTTDFLGGNDTVNDLAIQADGKIVAVGQIDTPIGFDFGLARYNTDGSLDTSFDGDGKVFTDFLNNTDFGNAVAIQPDQKIIAAGEVRTSTNLASADFGLARYLNEVTVEPEFDVCIQGDGGGVFLFDSATGDYQFTDCLGLTITGTGRVNQRGSIITLDQMGPDRRVIVRVTGNRAIVTIQIFSPRRIITFTDGDLTNNSCACG